MIVPSLTSSSKPHFLCALFAEFESRLPRVEDFGRMGVRDRVRKRLVLPRMASLGQYLARMLPSSLFRWKYRNSQVDTRRILHPSHRLQATNVQLHRNEVPAHCRFLGGVSKKPCKPFACKTVVIRLDGLRTATGIGNCRSRLARYLVRVQD